MVAILIGSPSDHQVMLEAAKVLDRFGVPYEMTVTSAHRSPERTLNYARSIEKRGIQVVIVGAGGAAHLAGVVAAHTTVPVIGVPIDSSSLKGLDALLATVQMPSGVPVGTVAIGKAGAKNAALYAIEILALSDKTLSERLKEHRQKMAKEVEEAAASIEKRKEGKKE